MTAAGARAGLVVATALGMAAPWQASLPACAAESPAAAAQAAPAPAGGLAGYQGSAKCAECHAAESGQWKESAHARTLHEPSASEKALLDRALLCGDEEATQVLGERHARRFLAKSAAEPGRHVMLPCRYDVGPAEWVAIHGADWRSLTFEKGCGACHTTGFSSDDLTWRETSVGCEACHGPASRHGDFTARGGMIAFGSLAPKAEVTICASCHLQGGRSRSTGLNFARNFSAGDDLFADYQFDWSALEAASKTGGNPIDVHQKLLIREWAGGGAGGGAGRGAGGAATGLRCTSCHEFHQMGFGKHEKLPRQEFCHLCHRKTDFKLKEYGQSCNVCEF